MGLCPGLKMLLRRNINSLFYCTSLISILQQMQLLFCSLPKLFELYPVKWPNMQYLFLLLMMGSTRFWPSSPSVNSIGRNLFYRRTGQLDLSFSYSRFQSIFLRSRSQKVWSLSLILLILLAQCFCSQAFCNFYLSFSISIALTVSLLILNPSQKSKAAFTLPNSDDTSNPKPRKLPLILKHAPYISQYTKSAIFLLLSILICSAAMRSRSTSFGSSSLACSSCPTSWFQSLPGMPPSLATAPSQYPQSSALITGISSTNTIFSPRFSSWVLELLRLLTKQANILASMLGYCWVQLCSPSMRLGVSECGRATFCISKYGSQSSQQWLGVSTSGCAFIGFIRLPAVMIIRRGQVKSGCGYNIQNRFVGDSMAQVTGAFGPITIANELLQPGSTRKANLRPPHDPLNFIKISCDIPKENSYSIGNTDVFNFGQELEKLKITRYTDILKIENEYSELVAKFKY